MSDGDRSDPPEAVGEMNSLIPALVSALLITIALEFVVLFLLIRTNPGFLLLSMILINGTTNPFLNYLVIFSGCPVPILEVGVIITESFLIALLTRSAMKTALIWSCCANGCSYLIGPFLMRMIVT
jgi:hypothetical protein